MRTETGQARLDSPPSIGCHPRMIGRTVRHFRFDEEIGQGGMARVYKAWDSVLNRFVAVKVLSPAAGPKTGGDSASDEYALVLHEARAASRLDHPNIAPVYEVFAEDSRAFMVMQLVAGPTLRERLRRGEIPLPEAVQILLSIARGLAEAHRMNVLHRDIKPENVLLTERGEVKITDFGLARIAHVDRSTITGSIRGTPAYMPPELLAGLDPDARGDIFSAGVLFHELLTGRHPFSAPHQAGTLNAILNEDPPHVSDLRPEVSVEVSKVIHRMMEKDPEHRYADGQGLLDALEEAVGITPLNPRAPMPVTRRRIGRRLLLPAAAVLFLLAILTARDWPGSGPTRIMLSGRVTDTDSRPVEGARVTIDGHSFLARTTSNGGFRGDVIDAMKDEAVLMRISHERHITETRWVTLTSGSIDTLSFRLKPLEESR